LGQISQEFETAGYDANDHIKRNYDVTRDGKINAIDLGVVAQLFGDCPPI
jgi:hypothetical protein